MKFLSLTFLGLAIFPLGILADSKCDNDCIGRVVRVDGQVQRYNLIKNSNNWLKIGETIVEKDELKIRDNGYVKILMKDDTILQLGSDSAFKFENFNLQENNNRQGVYDLTNGTLRALFPIKAKDREITIKTPAVSMGIHGTEILAEVHQVMNQVKTDVALISGSVQMLLNGQEKNNFVLKAGEVFRSLGGGGNKMVINEVKLIPIKVIEALKQKKENDGTTFWSETVQNVGDKSFNTNPSKIEGSQVQGNRTPVPATTHSRQ